MTEETSEILVVLAEGETAEDALRQVGHAVHMTSGRVLTVQLPPSAGDLSQLRASPAVRWAGTDPPADVIEQLDAEERLFVDGWLLRRGGKAERPADGLDWDAPGRLPPDQPTSPEGRKP